MLHGGRAAARQCAFSRDESLTGFVTHFLALLFSLFFPVLFLQCPPEKDFKSRFFWRIGRLPENDKHKDLNMPQVVPKNFPNWAETMNGWGETILRQSKMTQKQANNGSCEHCSALSRVL